MIRAAQWVPRLLVPALLAACARARPPVPRPLALPFAADTLRTQQLRPGVLSRFIYAPSGPWAIHVLEIDLDRCYSALAVKGANGAIGRTKTSTLLRELAATRDVIGGVNADFFSLAAPLGVPVGALVSNGRVVTGPTVQPVLAFDAAGMASITTVRSVGSAFLGAQVVDIAGWNRAAPRGLALFDAAWGLSTDTATAAIEVVLTGHNPSRVAAIDTTTAGVLIPTDGAVLVAGRNAPENVRAGLLALKVGDTIRTTMSLAPFQPREAVGGRPLLLRDSVVSSAVDTSGQASFIARNPRTAAGVARNGKRLILAVVDGRQAPYSDGMSLRELANLMRALGARDALNLDGGGSTTLVYTDPDSPGALRVANRPSDKEGERAVGDALAIVRGCGGRQ
ncbi:MAG: hypothetical protein JWM41_3131 [Gemmatimonadetes bacterium]|nr:hypothetical protein [Gemmatimonadota bacterium]